jgi:hypothetical protein
LTIGSAHTTGRWGGMKALKAIVGVRGPAIAGAGE